LANLDHNGPYPERVWALKPWWCQPWSILATGLALGIGSWWLLQRFWLTGLVALAVALWWWLFLVLMPAQWRDWVRSQAGDPAAPTTDSAVSLNGPSVSRQPAEAPPAAAPPDPEPRLE
jgi:hypothetical protein